MPTRYARPKVRRAAYMHRLRPQAPLTNCYVLLHASRHRPEQLVDGTRHRALTLPGRINMFRALSNARALRERVAQPVEQLTFNQ